MGISSFAVFGFTCHRSSAAMMCVTATLMVEAYRPAEGISIAVSSPHPINAWMRALATAQRFASCPSVSISHCVGLRGMVSCPSALRVLVSRTMQVILGGAVSWPPNGLVSQCTHHIQEYAVRKATQEFAWILAAMKRRVENVREAETPNLRRFCGISPFFVLREKWHFGTVRSCELA